MSTETPQRRYRQGSAYVGVRTFGSTPSLGAQPDEEGANIKIRIMAPIQHGSVLPESYQLDRLAGEWEQFETVPAFEKDGTHPREGFARYLIGHGLGRGGQGPREPLQRARS